MKKHIELTDKESKILKDVFGENLDYSKLKYCIGGLYSYKCTRTVGNCVYFDVETNFEENRGSYFINSLILHETVHMWQYQKFGWIYAIGSLWDQLKGFIKTGSRGAAYRYALDENKKFSDYGFEQQAQMIQDYWLIKTHNYKFFAKHNCSNFEDSAEFFEKYEILTNQVKK
jgi:hypothetical protein